MNVTEGKAASYLALSFILLVLALGGWGAFAYSLYAARHEARFLRTEVGRSIAERQTLTSALSQMRDELERSRQILRRTQADLERTQAELVLVKADAAFMAEQLKARALPQASPPPPTPSSRRRNTR